MEDMSHITGRAGVSAAIDDLVDAVRRLTRGALQLKSAETAVLTTEVERTLAGALAAAWDSGNPEPQYEVKNLAEGSTADKTPQKSTSSERENLIAAGIAELQDRLGGFIKS